MLNSSPVRAALADAAREQPDAQIPGELGELLDPGPVQGLGDRLQLLVRLGVRAVDAAQVQLGEDRHAGVREPGEDALRLSREPAERGMCGPRGELGESEGQGAGHGRETSSI